MATSLASQLARLQQRPGTDKKLAHSFLFSDSDAKGFSRDQIYELAMSGLETLLRIDNRLHPFLANIFSKAHVRRERAMLTSAEAEESNKHMEALLSLLAPHLFLTAAQQVIEYLVRVWEIHSYNVGDVLETFLPYHDHSLFARMVLLLDLRDTGFEALSKNQMTGAPLLGSQLRVLCGESRKALRAVCNCATKAVKYSVANHAAFALYTGVCSSLAIHPDGEALFRTIIPTLNDFISWSSASSNVVDNNNASGFVESVRPNAAAATAGGASSSISLVVRGESLSAALVVLCAWSQETQFGARVLSALLKPFLRALLHSTFPVPIRDAIIVLGVLFRSQGAAVQDASFTPVLRQLIDLPWRDWAGLIPQQQVASSRPSSTAELFSSLLRYVCVSHLVPSENPESLPADVRQFLLTASEVLPLTQEDVSLLLGTVARHRPLHAAFCGGSSDIAKVLPAVRRRVPLALDRAIVELMRPAAASTTTTNASKSAAAASAAAVTEFIERFFQITDAAESTGGENATGALTATAYKRIDISSVGGNIKKTSGGSESTVTTRVPLSVCLMHYLSEVRRIALGELTKLSPTDVAHCIRNTKNLSSVALVDVLLYVVRFDSDLVVVNAALNILKSWVAAVAKKHDDNEETSSTAANEAATQSFLAVASEAIYECAVGLTTLPQTPAAGGQQQPLVATFESAIALLTFVTNSTSTTAASALAKYHILLIAQSTATSLDAYISGTFGPIALSAVLAASSIPKKDVPSDSSVSTVLLKSPALRDAVLTVASTPGRRHFRTVFQRVLQEAQRPRGEAASTEQAAEINILVASASAVGLEGTSAFAAQADEILDALVAWVDPNGKSSFTAVVRSVAQEALTKQLAERGPGATGRGAKAAADGAVEGAVSSHVVSKQVVAALLGAMDSILPAVEKHTATASQINAGVAIVKTVRVLTTNSTVVAPSTVVPTSAFFAAPKTISRVLLRCLETPSPFATKDWHSEIGKLLITPAASSSSHRAALEVDGQVVILLLLVPALPSADEDNKVMTMYVQQLQHHVTEAMTSKKKTVSNIPAAAIVQSVIAANLLSATGFSAVIEAIALGRPGAESTRAAAPLPADAARIVAGWVAAGAAAQFQLPLLNIFFPLPSAGNVQSGGQREERRRGNHVLLLSEMLPRINDALVKSQEALSRSKIASLSSTEIEVVEYLLRGIHSLENNNNSKNGDEVTETETFLTCFLSAYPSILIAESGKDYAPVYREALSAMARIFAPASSSTAGAKSTTVIFTAGKSAAPNKGKQTAVAAAPNSGNAASSQRLHGLLVALWSRHGADVAQYAACTAAGMESLLLPLMRRATSTSAGQQQLDVAFVIEALEAKFSPNATTWTTLEAVAASSPQLQASEALAFVKSQSALLVDSTTVAATDSDISSRLTALRAASLLLGSAVALAHNTDDDDDDDDVSPAHHAATFATAVLDAVPLSCLGTLVISAAATSASSLTAARSAVVAFATTLTKCVVEHNSEADLFTALRHSATKELLALMTTVLGHGDSEDALSTTSDAVATVEVTKGAAGMVNFVGKLLTAIAPLLNESESTTGSSSSSSTSLLHVVILALMLRLEPLSGTEVLQFRTVVECCRDIITTFDVDTQMMCIAGVMRTLMYPHNPLKRSIESEVAGGDNESHGDDNEDEASAAHGGIVKKLLKANKIINRQELILELVVSTLKSDEFLAPFIAQQQRGGGSNRHQLKKKKSSQEEEAAAAAAAGEEDEGKEAEAHSSHDTCMQLLLTSLGLFAHYHTLNESTENVIDNTPTSDEEEGAVISEEKSFVMMLELLSGNALGCILAGINEPTFVECLKRLLNDSRVALQVKGLEMLVDRLHQAVPTIEDTLTDSEAEQRRRDLRDPRKKLTNYDLLLLKARPLATKRTMALFPLMHHLLSGSLRTVVKSSATAAPHRQLVLLAQLGITAMEELARTVGSGGSLHSEATLAQSERSLVVSEAQVFKLFGSKAKAAEVKTFLSLLLTQLGPLQQRITALSSADASSVAATKKSTSATAIELAALFASAVTAVATIVQTLGAAFVASFSNEIMQVSSSALSFCVSTMPGELARAPIGSLVRVACFNTVLRVFSATWLMCAPYLPQILAASCHKTSVSDSETSASSAELLRTIKALIEPRVMLECCCTALSGSSSSAPTIKATTHNFTVLFECIESLVQSLTKRDIAAMPVLVADIPEVSRNMWIAALQSLASMPQLPTADEANAVSDAFLAMIVKFKSDDCKRHITTLLSWAFEELTGGAAATAAKKSEKKGSKKADDDDIDVSLAPTVSNSKQGLHRMILFLGLHNRVVDKLQSLSEFSFAAVSGALVPTFVQSIRRSSDAQDDDDEDDVRGRKRSAGLDALSTLLLESALDAVRRMSDAQVPAPDTPVAAITTPYFAEAKVFNALMPPFLQQLGNVRVLTDESRTYDHRIVHTVIPAFRSFFKALASPKLWSSAQAELLKHLRSPKHQVRRAVLRAFRSIYTDGGDEMAATIMSEMLPAVVEATEDTHSDVVEEARLLCNDLSTISGRDVLHAMS